jgi:hypothetical protein
MLVDVSSAIIHPDLESAAIGNRFRDGQQSMDMSIEITRRRFLQATGAGLLGAAVGWGRQRGSEPIPGERPKRDAGAQVLNPLERVPVSLIIDDSTCLVNLAFYAIPQFAEVFPDRYTQNWRELPREIPDSFVREFAEWCHEHGVKGKYSVVPFPACVGWIDRFLPGWTRKELDDSLELVRSVILPDWDIHPEMVSHTWVIDTKTGRPYPERSERFMENWRWTDGKSVDQLADYMSYALRILKNAGLPCEGITTPGGFGNRVLAELAQATLQACRDVYRAEVPHYFRHLFTDDRSVLPRVEYASGLDTDDPRCVVSIIGCTGDWFGGWDGMTPGSIDQFITADLQGGRLPQVISRNEPAILVCHWPGMYFNGEEIGFEIFKGIVRRLEARYDNLIWMKLSEIARYWAARELTGIERKPAGYEFRAPFAAADFTVQINARAGMQPTVVAQDKKIKLRALERPNDLDSGTYYRDGERLVLAFDLPKGRSVVELSGD